MTGRDVLGTVLGTLLETILGTVLGTVLGVRAVMGDMADKRHTYRDRQAEREGRKKASSDVVLNRGSRNARLVARVVGLLTLLFAGAACVTSASRARWVA